MKIAIIVGTRPEVIKESPIVRICEGRNLDYFMIHTGQHYSYNMDRLFFKQLQLPSPKYNLKIKSTAPYMQGEHTGRMLIEIEDILLKEMPDIVLVHGDTNTTLAGALTTKKISTTASFTGFDIKLGHVEAGLRSHDHTMPEEINRRIVDHLSDYLFAPTGTSAQNAIREGVAGEIAVTGNTIVDVLFEAMRIMDGNEMDDKLGIEHGKYLLATVHRQENVDSKQRFENIMKGFGLVHKRLSMPIVYPAHPRAKRLIEKFNLKIPDGVMLTDPVGFFEFLKLEKNAGLILTDSGGVQEESCILKVPCVTLRENTERPETIRVGGNMLAGTDPKRIEACAAAMFKRKRSWPNPLGDGRSGEKIVNFILGVKNARKNF